jgi:Holliday junction resolvasome RuvABC endonuclease subunit
MTALFDLAPSPAAPVPAPPAGAGPRLRVLGLDLSLTSTGIALPDGTTARIKTRQKDGDRRLIQIRDYVRATIRSEHLDLAVIEDLPKNAMAAGITAHVHGIVKAELLDACVPYALIAPATLKSYACDHGSADKTRMAAAAYLAAGVEFQGDPGGDQCDAWWLRAAGHDHWGAPLFSLPQGQRDRLSKAKWPARKAVAR